jgi:hypothetical protein
MKRDDLRSGHRRVLAVLEQAWKDQKVRSRQEWVSSMELANAAGLRFGGRINEMDNVTHPVKGLGFRIERSEQPKASRKWFYRLAGYPVDWTDTRIFGSAQGRLFEAA